eukprot:c5455_g1_i1.p1 GENE.c5455_g1_i1~~c5455_g1_i1.p1  ORF type:complete len:856 (+),score=187.65 c5455_g1_i1:140-2569(+)
MHFLADPRQEVESEMVELVNAQKRAEKDAEASKKFDKEVWQREPKSKRWRLCDLREVQVRRYLLSTSALEFFFFTGHSCFINFDQQDTRVIFRRLTTLRTPNLLVRELLPPQELFRRSNVVTQAWIEGHVSNFDYLMLLNTLAGRTYWDLNQYPVFPWVLSNYTSTEIDLENPLNYRDLSKPLGAMNQDRLKQIVERYESHIEAMGIPRFHYGSHYSTAGIVLFFLIRLEPFATWNISLQGGKFDVPERLFNSIQSAWSSSLSNSSDFKELTPEFYYLPDFLLNANDLPLGHRDGVKIHHVNLPPWAKDAADFIRIQREALESPIVSQNIHKWIDLIFGYKQRGREAELAHNVFYYLTYEGAVNLEEIEPEMRTAIIQQAKYFGQTPSQLLTEPHPARKQQKVPRSLCTETDAIKVFRLERAGSKSNAVIAIHLNDRDVVSVCRDGSHNAFEWTSAWDDRLAEDRSERNFQPFAFRQVDADTHTIASDPLFITDKNGNKEVCVAITPKGRWMMYGKRWDNSILVRSLNSGRIAQTVCGHDGIVDCLAVANPSGRALVSGGRDCRVAIWGFVTEGTRTFVGVRSGSRDEEELIDSDKRSPLSKKPLRYLYGHTSWIVCVAADTSVDCVVSASLDGTILVHTLIKGKFLRKLSLQPSPPPLPRKPQSQVLLLPELEENSGNTAPDHATHIVLSWRGDIVFSTQQNMISHFTINGEHRASIPVSSSVTCLGLTAVKSELIVATSGTICFYDLTQRLHRIHRCKVDSSAIRCVSSHRLPSFLRDVVFCGLDSGHILVLHNGKASVPNIDALVY